MMITYFIYEFELLLHTYYKINAWMQYTHFSKREKFKCYHIVTSNGLRNWNKRCMQESAAIKKKVKS